MWIRLPKTDVVSTLPRESWAGVWEYVRGAHASSGVFWQLRLGSSELESFLAGTGERGRAEYKTLLPSTTITPLLRYSPLDSLLSCCI